MAPLIPFMSEAIYQNLKRPNDPSSVHLATWPKVINSYLNKELEDQMALILQSVRLAHALRSSANIKNRIPLAKLYVVSRNADERATFIKMSEVLQEEVNVKSVVVESAEERLVDYTMKANFKILGKVLGKDMKVGASAIEALPTRAILSLLAGERLTIEFSGVQMNHLEIGLEDVLITRHAKADVQTISEGHLTVALDTTLTPELLREGMMRDLIRAIQNLRKESDFAVSDRITFTLVVENAEIEAEFALILSEFGAFIKREVLATNHSLSVGVSDSASDIVVGTFSAKLVVKRV